MRNKTSVPPWRSLAEISANTIVRWWPEETKDWGRAFAAELPEVETFRATCGWLIGGIMLLTRERLRHFFVSLGLPFGVPVSGPLDAAVRTSRQAPRTPRLVTLLLLLASAALLLHPEMRTCLGLALSSISPDNWNDPRWRSVHQLEKAAAKTNDPRLYALLSLLSGDERHARQTNLAEKAIAADPSLTWLEYRYPPAEPTGRLKNWDPDNSVVRLIPAELRFMSIEEAVHDSSGYVRNHGPELTPLEKAAAGDGEWLAAMDHALAASKYDTYATQQLHLVRDVARAYQIDDPDVALKVLLAQRLPYFPNLAAYAHILFKRSAEAERRGDTAAAIADASKILLFAQKMQLNARTSLEEAIAAQLAEQACENLQPAFEKAGRIDDASSAALELVRWKAFREGLKLRYCRARESQAGSQAWAALSIHVAALAVVALTGASLAGLAFLSWRNRAPVGAAKSLGWRVALTAITVDLAPVLLLFASLTMFLVYHPYAVVYQSYLEHSEAISNAEGMESFLSAGVVAHLWPAAVEQTIGTPRGEYVLWLSATVLLSGLVVLLIYRLWLRHHPA